MFTSVHSNYSCTTLKIYSVYEMMHVAIGYPCILRNPGSLSLWYFTILLWICFLMFHVMFFPWVFPIFLGVCSVCYFCGCIFWFPSAPPLLPGAVRRPSTPFCVSSSDGPITFMWLLAVLFCSHTVVPYPMQQDFFPCELSFLSPCTDLHSSHSSLILITLHSSSGCPCPWGTLCSSPAISNVVLPAYGALFPTFFLPLLYLPACLFSWLQDEC